MGNDPTEHRSGDRTARTVRPAAAPGSQLL